MRIEDRESRMETAQSSILHSLSSATDICALDPRPR
jgi:hypothetical protein